MKSEVFISELHDIGKLADVKALKDLGIKLSGQTFQNFDFSQLNISTPSSPSWYGQYSNEIGSLTSTRIPEHYLPDVLLTSMADELSSAISRTWSGSKKFKERKEKDELVAKGLYVLWNPSFYDKEEERGNYWAAFRTPDELRKMFEFIDECKNPTDFFERFGKNLKLTAEDKSVPFNVVDLFTHLELTGKIYRILKKHSRVIKEDDKLYLEYLNKRVQTKNEATGGRIDQPNQRGKWIFRLIFCYVRFPQSFSRLQDLNILKERVKIIRAFSENENTRDYVLFFTDDFMCLFVPREEEAKIHEMLEQFREDRFIIDCEEMEAELSLLTSSMKNAYCKFHNSSTSRYLKLYEKRVSMEPSPELHPNICDSCQMEHGEEARKEQVREYLCNTCKRIRDMGEPAREYAEWKGKAAWMKIALDQKCLSDRIDALFKEYVDNSRVMQSVDVNDKNKLKESFRPLAVQMAFVKDYEQLLREFKDKIYEIEDAEGNQFFTKETFLYPIDDYNEFGIFKVYSGEAILKVIDTFTNLLEEYFPKCVDNSPIKLAISVAHVKYPYQEHWRFLSEPKETIDIQSSPAELILNVKQYKTLREKIGKENVKLSHFLHRLADIKEKTDSDMTVRIEVYDKDNRKKFPVILELLEEGLTPKQILEYYNLAREEEIHE